MAFSVLWTRIGLKVESDAERCLCVGLFVRRICDLRGSRQKFGDVVLDRDQSSQGTATLASATFDFRQQRSGAENMQPILTSTLGLFSHDLALPNITVRPSRQPTKHPHNLNPHDATKEDLRRARCDFRPPRPKGIFRVCLRYPHVARELGHGQGHRCLWCTLSSTSPRQSPGQFWLTRICRPASPS